jgi:hypothetical protein
MNDNFIDPDVTVVPSSHRHSYSGVVAAQKDNIGNNNIELQQQPHQQLDVLLLNSLIMERDHQRQLYHHSLSLIERTKQQVLLVDIMQRSLSQSSQQQHLQPLQQPFMAVNQIQDNILMATTANSQTGAFDTINDVVQSQSLQQPFITVNPIQDNMLTATTANSQTGAFDTINDVSQQDMSLDAKAGLDLMTTNNLCNALHPVQQIQNVKTNTSTRVCKAFADPVFLNVF